MNALIERLFRDSKIKLGAISKIQVRATDVTDGTVYVYDLREGDDALPEIYSMIDRLPELEPDKDVLLIRDHMVSTWGAAMLHVRTGEWSMRTTGWDQLEHLIGPYFLGQRDGTDYLVNVSARDQNQRELKK